MLNRYIKISADFRITSEYAPDLAAPVRKGDVIGQAYIRSDGETLAGCPLLAAEDIDRWNFAAALKSVLRNWLIKLP